MSLVDRIDLKIGGTLFVPAIVTFCQWTRQSQYAVSRLFWFIAALDGLYRAETLLAQLLFGGLSLIMMVTAALRADRPTRSFLWFRMAALLFLGLDILAGIATARWAGIEFWIFVLIAEYAATIRTLPPREARQGAASASSVR